MGITVYSFEAHPRMCCEVSSWDLGSRCLLLSPYLSSTTSVYLQEPVLLAGLCLDSPISRPNGSSPASQCAWPAELSL